MIASRTPCAIAASSNECAVRIVDDRAVADFDALARRIAPDGADSKTLAVLLSDLANALIELDATLIEINPLAVTADGQYVALDAKMTIDDNALFRHREIAAWREAVMQEEGDPGELASDRHNLNYIAHGRRYRPGRQRRGARPGDAGHAEGCRRAARPISWMCAPPPPASMSRSASTCCWRTRRLRAVLLNVHGGGMQRCDTIVEGVAISMRRSGRRPPLVVRLAGNNADFARERLKAFGIEYTEGATMAEAVERVVGHRQERGGLMAILIGAHSRVICQGHDRPRRQLSCAAHAGLWDQGRGGGDAGQGRAPGARCARLRNRARRQGCHGRQCDHPLRPARQRGARHDRGHRGGNAAGGLRHRAGAGAGHDPGARCACRARGRFWSAPIRKAS